MTRRKQQQGRGETHGEQRRAVHGELDDLDGGVIARLDGRVGGERDLGQADGARVGVLAGAQDLEGRHHGEAHVPGAVVWPVGAEAHVDVEEGRGVALEPAWLEGECAARRGPVCAVCCCWVATAWEGNMPCQLICSGLAMAHNEAGVEPVSLRREERVCDSGSWGKRLTWVHPLHAERECVVGNEIVTSPSGICEDGVC